MSNVSEKQDPERVIRNVLFKSCDRLDRRDYQGFLDLCADSFSYRVTAYSPEIRREMIWLEKDKAGLAELFKMMPVHNRDRRPIARHFSIFDVEYEDDQSEVTVNTGVQVFRTETDGGATSLVAVGRYIDKISLEQSVPTLLSRELRLETRMLGIGFHEPL